VLQAVEVLQGSDCRTLEALLGTAFDYENRAAAEAMRDHRFRATPQWIINTYNRNDPNGRLVQQLTTHGVVVLDEA
jgi:hypothetical protein